MKIESNTICKQVNVFNTYLHNEIIYIKFLKLIFNISIQVWLELVAIKLRNDKGRPLNVEYVRLKYVNLFKPKTFITFLSIIYLPTLNRSQAHCFKGFLLIN